MRDSDKAIDSAVNTVEVFGKVFEVSATAALILKTAGVATLGAASVLTGGVVPIVIGSVICATALGKYALDKYQDSHSIQHKPDDLMKPLSERFPSKHKPLSPEQIEYTLKKSGDFGIFSKIAENLTALGVSSKNKSININNTKHLDIEKEKTRSLPSK